MKKNIAYAVVMLGAMSLSLPACNGIFDGIYDNAQAGNTTLEFGFNNIDNGAHSGTLYLDATSYTKWLYIDLHALAIDSTFITGEDGTEEPLPATGEMPDEWDFAIHRYDTKTHGGAVLETSFTDLKQLLASQKIPEGNYVEDLTGTTDKIVIDMSDMITEEKLKYAVSDFNEELTKWLNVDKSQMPPIYTLSGKVYVLRMKDGTHAALKLTDFRNNRMIKGILTIDYIYPLEAVFK